MKRYILVVAIALLLAPRAFGQTPPTTELDSRQLSADWQSLLNDMTHVAHGLEEYIQTSQRQIAQIKAESEAQKATLIEWLKAAQAEASVAKK